MTHITRVDALPGVWKITADTNGYLLVRGTQSLLIDCPCTSLVSDLAAAGLPAPEIILHTQVQEEHCREWAAFPDARVVVYSESVDVARHADAFFRDTATVWPPSREWDSRGEEKYGIGGCTTERIPRQPLHVAEVLEPGQLFHWHDIELEVLALPGSGKRALGFFWRQQQALFSGDLLQAGGYLVNCYDLERSYGGVAGYAQLRDSLATVAALQPALVLPSSGALLDEPLRDIALLEQRIAWVWSPPVLRANETAAAINYPPRREFGRYREILPGLLQNTNSGNIILFVNDDGAGLMIDPDPCVWLSWEENCREMHADLDLLERETGLQRVEMALLTHYHGDHVQYCNLLRERYGSDIRATPDVAALLAQPEAYPYPCLLDWYGFPFTHLQVDTLLGYDQRFCWHDVTITPVHTPGHCYAHAAFMLDWQGTKIACCGDAFQYGQGPMLLGMPILYNDTAWPERGSIATYRALAQWRPALLLGGHSHCCYDADGTIIADWIAAAEASQRLAEAMLPAGQLPQAMTPPGYDALREGKEFLLLDKD